MLFSSVIILVFTVSLLKFTSQNQSTGAFRCMFNNIILYIFDYEKILIFMEDEKYCIY